MRRSIRVVTLASLLVGCAASAQQAPQYPVMEAVAQNVIQHYQAASCQQLWAEKAQPPTAQQAQTQAKAVEALRNDPGMRKAFVERVGAPVINKMFECGMIP